MDSLRAIKNDCKDLLVKYFTEQGEASYADADYFYYFVNDPYHLYVEDQIRDKFLKSGLVRLRISRYLRKAREKSILASEFVFFFQKCKKAQYNDNIDSRLN